MKNTAAHRPKKVFIDHREHGKSCHSFSSATNRFKNDRVATSLLEFAVFTCPGEWVSVGDLSIKWA